MNNINYNQKRYNATPANLRYNVARSGVDGQWDDNHPTALVFQITNGGALYWYPKDSSIELLGACEDDKQALLNALPALANA